MGHLSLYSQVLLLPLGIPPMSALAGFRFSRSHDSEAWRVLTTTADVGTVSQGQGALDHHSVTQSRICRHLAIGVWVLVHAPTPGVTSQSYGGNYLGGGGRCLSYVLLSILLFPCLFQCFFGSRPW